MATPNEITAAAGYVGNAALGDFTPSAFEIDTKPLQALAAYTVMYNQSQYNQRQKDADNKIQQLADISKLDLNNIRAKDKNIVLPQYGKYLDFARSYAAKGVPTNPQEKVEQELEFQKQTQDITAYVKGANARNIGYNARLNAINQADTPAKVKAVQKKQLDDDFDNTDIFTPISAMPNYSVVLPKIGNAAYSKNEVMFQGPNGVVSQTRTVLNPAKTVDSSFAEGNGFLVANTLPSNATPDEKRQFDLQQASGGDSKLWSDAAAYLTSAIQDPQFKNEDGTINYDAIKAANPIAGNYLDLTDRWNQYNDKLKIDIDAGTFRNNGLAPKGDVISSKDLIYFDKSKPYTLGGIISLQKFATASPDTQEEKYQFTGETVDLQKARIAQQGENYRKQLDIAKDKYVANLPYEKQKAGAVGADGQPLDFGNLIYSINSKPKEPLTINKTDGTNIPNLKINNGVVVDKNGNVVDYTGDLKIPETYLDNSIITEFNKYAGSSKVDANGVTVTNAPSKLLIQNGKVTIRMVGGQIQGIQTEGQDENTGGSFASADQFQHITLVAGQKGATKYKKADTDYGNQNNPKAPASSVQSVAPITLSGKVNTSTLITNQSYSVGGKNYIWNGKKLIAQ